MKKYILVCIVGICIAFNALAQVNYSWVKSIGGESDDIGTSIATDASGNTYVAANIGSNNLGSVDFDPYNTSSHILSLNTNGNYCAFAKYDDEGNCLWQKSFFSPGMSLFNVNFIISRIVVEVGDTAIFVAGAYVNNVNFGGITLNNPSDETPKPFLAKYRASNGDLIWVNDLGQEDGGVTAVAVHPNYPYVFFTVAANGLQDAVFGKCDLINGDTLYTKMINAVGGAVFPSSMALDYYANITITGSFGGTVDFNLDPNQDFPLTANAVDIFVAQYHAGGDFIWAKSFGGPDVDAGNAIAFNAAGDTIYIAGTVQNSASFSFGSPLSVVGIKEGFVAKLDNSGTIFGLNQIKASNTTDSVFVTSISLDASDNVYIAGMFAGQAVFNGISSSETLSANGATDIFFAKYNAGLELAWAEGIGGTSKDRAMDIALYNQSIYITGSFGDTVDFNPASGVANRIATFGTFPHSDLFFAKYSQGAARIKGNVYRSNNTPLDGTQGTGNMVRLYTQIMFDGNQAMNLVAETPINNVGYYEFNNVPEGEYLALAVVGSDYSDSIVATYHSNPFTDNAFQWEYATPILPVSTAPASVADIRMISLPQLNGTATLEGIVVFEDGYDQRTTIPSVGVIVRKEPGNTIIAHTETNSSGNYSFGSVSAVTGDTCYRVYVNITGLPIIMSNYRPSPGEYQTIDTLDFYVRTDSIYTTPSSIPSSVSQINLTKTSVTLYPNPNTGNATIQFMLTQPQTVTIEVYNLLGKKVAELLNESKQAGDVKLCFNAADKGMNPGIYLLHIKIGDEVITKKMIVME